MANGIYRVDRVERQPRRAEKASLTACISTLVFWETNQKNSRRGDVGLVRAKLGIRIHEVCVTPDLCLAHNISPFPEIVLGVAVGESLLQRGLVQLLCDRP